MLSKRNRRCGLEPDSSYELGRDGGRRELAPSASTMDVLIGLRIPPLSCEIRKFVSVGGDAHLISAMIVFATRASESEVASIMSSRRKMSSGERSLVEQDARNLVTLEWNLLSSRGSIRAMDPGRSLFINLMRVVDREGGKGHQYFAAIHAVTKKKKSSLAENITIP
jgi:hypothetical protein